jgi:hypothetical protein
MIGKIHPQFCERRAASCKLQSSDTLSVVSNETDAWDGSFSLSEFVTDMRVAAKIWNGS